MSIDLFNLCRDTTPGDRATQPSQPADTEDLWFDAASTSADTEDLWLDAVCTPADNENLWFDAVSTTADIDLLLLETTH